VKAIARGRDGLTGTNAFPELGEKPVPILDVRPPAPPPHGPVDVTVTALPSTRLSEPFEALRDNSDGILAKTGARPKIFLANLGTPSEFSARAAFAKNFFEAGGIEAAVNDGFATSADMIAAFKASGMHLACLCSTDNRYASDAVSAAAALRESGAPRIYLAGRPGELETALKDAGVHDFIYIGCDIVATLRAAHDTIAAKHTGERP
jgi:methylmalonyl-CoA mutase